MFFFYFLFIVSSLSNSNINSLDSKVNVFYHSIIYRLKLTTQGLLDKDVKDVYKDMIRPNRFHIEVYYYSLYYDINLIVKKYDGMTSYKKVFKCYLESINNLLYWNSVELRIPKYSYLFYICKNKYLTTTNTIQDSYISSTTKVTCFLLNLREKFTSIIYYRHHSRELYNLLFYTFSLLHSIESSYINDALIHFSMIYIVISKLNKGETLTLVCIYYLLDKIIDSLMPLSHVTKSFISLKSIILDIDNFPQSNHENVLRYKSYSYILMLENLIKRKSMYSERPYCKIYSIKPEVNENEDKIEKIENLISIFYQS